MPTLRKACSNAICPNAAEPGSTRCEEHSRERDYTQEESSRPSASRRGYTARWRRIRSVYIKNHPICVGYREPCGRPATEVDHITPLADGGTHRWSNLQAMCKSCHSRKTIAENRGEAGRVAARH